MNEFTFGPVELYLVSLDGDRPAPAVVDSLHELIASGAVRLLDFVIIHKNDDGSYESIEIEDHLEEYGFDDIEFGAIGVTGDEDIEGFAELVEPGQSAAVVALELAWAARLAGAVAASGAEVLSIERIPAAVVNTIVELDEEGE